MLWEQLLQVQAEGMYHESDSRGTDIPSYTLPAGTGSVLEGGPE
jgi:hypothetical protein